MIHLATFLARRGRLGRVIHEWLIDAVGETGANVILLILGAVMLIAVFKGWQTHQKRKAARRAERTARRTRSASRRGTGERRSRR